MDSIEGASFVLPHVIFETMASRFASVTSKEIIQINDEAVPENTMKTTKFGLAVFKDMVYVFNPKFIDKNQWERFCLQMQINLA